MKKLLSLILLLSFTIKAQVTDPFATEPIEPIKAKDVKIGTQIWSNKNLDVSTYRNGDPIPEVQDKTAWANLTTGAWCFGEYGKLYNWYAVNDPRGLAPNGYHIPTDAEWTILTDYLGGEKIACKKMKSTNGWPSTFSGRGSYEKTCPNCSKWSAEYCNKVPCHTCKDQRTVSAYEPVKELSGNGTNTSGFYGLPGGMRSDNGEPYGYNSQWGYWWSSSEDGTYFPIGRCLTNWYGYGVSTFSFYYKQSGMSVRCIKD